MCFRVVLIFAAALAANAQFGGLGGSAAEMPAPGAVSAATSTGFRPWLSANGFYARILGDQPVLGGLREQFFPTFAGGANGWKSWGTRHLAASYSGSGSRRNFVTDTAGGLWQQNHVGTLGYAQQVSQRLSFSVTQAAGRTYGGFGSGASLGTAGVPGFSGSFGPGSIGGGFAGGLFDNLAQNGAVDNEFFDDRVNFSVTSGNIGYLLTQRTMVSVSGEASLVRRTLRAYDQRGYGGGAAISHQLSRTTMFGGGYQRIEVRYPTVFGGVSGDSGYFSLKLTPTPRTTFSLNGGATLLNSTFIGAVAIDPAIAALIGAGSVLQVTRTRFLTPVFNAELNRTFQMGTLSLSAGRGINPGNGLLYAGVRDVATASFSRSFHDRFGASAVASYFRMSGRVGTLAVNRSVQGSGMLSVKLMRGTSLAMQGGMRTIESGAIYTRKEVFAGVGLVWQPTSQPFIF